MLQNLTSKNKNGSRNLLVSCLFCSTSSIPVNAGSVSKSLCYKKTNDVSKLVNFIFSVIFTELRSSKFYVVAIYVRQWLPVWLISRTLHVGGIMWLVSYAISYFYVFLTDSLPGRVGRGNRVESYSSGWNFHDKNDWTVDSKTCLCLYVYQLAFIIFIFFRILHTSEVTSNETIHLGQDRSWS